MAKAHGIIYSTVKSPKHPRLCGTNQGLELRKHSNGYLSRSKFSGKGLWHKGEKLNSFALSQESSLLCRSNPAGLHNFQPLNFPCHHSLHLANPSLQLRSKSFRYQRLYCQSDPPTPSSSTPQENLVVEPGSSTDNNASKPTGSSNDNGIPEYPNKSVNRQIAVVSVLAAVGLFLSGRLDFGVSLKDLSAAALPYEEALSNGKPTVVEFYADWCEVCRELAPDVYKVEQQYKDRVNFVMLNVDNTKWEQELDEFGVEGIPHFAFLDKMGNEEGNVVGRLPRQYLSENVDALARGEASIPHARVVGQFSSAEARKVHQLTDPRSHG